MLSFETASGHRDKEGGSAKNLGENFLSRLTISENADISSEPMRQEGDPGINQGISLGWAEQQLKNGEVILEEGERSQPEEKQEDNEQQSSFSAEAAEKKLRQKTALLVEEQFIKDFFAKFHTDDLSRLKSILSREATMGRPSNRSLAGVIKSVADKMVGANDGKDRYDFANIQQDIVQLVRDYHEWIGHNFSLKEILHYQEADPIAVLSERCREVNLARMRSNKFNDVSLMGQYILDYLVKEIADQKINAHTPDINEGTLENNSEPQKWLNQEREAAFNNLGERFRFTIESDGIEKVREWFAGIINSMLKDDRQPIISSQDLSSLYYCDVTSGSASMVAGQKINRPVLVFSDIAQYQRVASLLMGEKGLGSRGMNMPRSWFKDGPFSETGLLVATNDEGFVAHEIRHSIDNLERQGWDTFITEAFAFYEKGKNTKEGVCHYLRMSLKNDLYYKSFAKTGQPPLTEEQYRDLCDLAVDAVGVLQEKMGHLDAQRSLVQMRGLKDLFEATDQELPDLLKVSEN